MNKIDMAFEQGKTAVIEKQEISTNPYSCRQQPDLWAMWNNAYRLETNRLSQSNPIEISKENQTIIIDIFTSVEYIFEKIAQTIEKNKPQACKPE